MGNYQNYYSEHDKFFTHSDITFITKHLYTAFSNLRVFVLQPDNPYIEKTEIIEFVNSDKIDIVVHPVITHPWSYDFIEQHFKKVGIDKPWLQITWNQNLKGKNYIHLDYWAINIHDSIYTWGMDYYKNTEIKKEYKFSCVNNTVKMHRLVTLYNLFCENLFDSCVYSVSECLWGTRLDKTLSTNVIQQYSDHYNAEEFDKFWSLIPTKCPQEIDELIPFWTHDAWVNSYVNIVTEHTFSLDFVSEKSIKPFLCEQMAIFVSGPGTVAKLRSLGLDVFDDYIDHSYDTEIDDKTRFQLINELIKKLNNNNWHEIYESTRERRLGNRQKILDESIKEYFLQCLKNKIDAILGGTNRFHSR